MTVADSTLRLRPLPQHVAVIMDGNGRWAQAQGKPRIEGHKEGAKTVREITTFARELGIPYLTLYSFSLQNWQRHPDEISGLMHLLENYCHEEWQTLAKHDIRFNAVGDLTRLPDSTREAVDRLMVRSKHHRQMTLTLALSYGGREEIVMATNRLLKDAQNSRTPLVVDEKLFATKLYTTALPDPDLVIRTSGEYRVSNFLLWQMAYAELYFSSVLWPDFHRGHFEAALQDFQGRERRFGGIRQVTTVC